MIAANIGVDYIDIDCPAAPATFPVDDVCTAAASELVIIIVPAALAALAGVAGASKHESITIIGGGR